MSNSFHKLVKNFFLVVKRVGGKRYFSSIMFDSFVTINYQFGRTPDFLTSWFHCFPKYFAINHRKIFLCELFSAKTWVAWTKIWPCGGQATRIVPFKLCVPLVPLAFFTWDKSLRPSETHRPIKGQIGLFLEQVPSYVRSCKGLVPPTLLMREFF